MQWVTHDFYEYKNSKLKAQFSTRLQDALAHIFTSSLVISGSALVFILPWVFLSSGSPPETVSYSEVLFFQTTLGAVGIVLLNIAINSYFLLTLTEDLYCVNKKLAKKLRVKLNLPEEYNLFVNYNFKWSKLEIALLILFGGLWVRKARRECMEEKERLMDEQAGNAYGVYGEVKEEDSWIG